MLIGIRVPTIEVFKSDQLDKLVESIAKRMEKQAKQDETFVLPPNLRRSGTPNRGLIVRMGIDDWFDEIEGKIITTRLEWLASRYVSLIWLSNPTRTTIYAPDDRILKRIDRIGAHLEARQFNAPNIRVADHYNQRMIAALALIRLAEK